MLLWDIERVCMYSFGLISLFCVIILKCEQVTLIFTCMSNFRMTQDTLSQNMAPWHIEYLKLEGSGKMADVGRSL